MLYRLLQGAYQTLYTLLPSLLKEKTTPPNTVVDAHVKMITYDYVYVGAQQPHSLQDTILVERTFTNKLK